MISYDDMNSTFNIQKSMVVWRDIPSLKNADLCENGTRYGAWINNLQELSSLPIEYVLPRIPIEYRDELPNSMIIAEERFREAPETAREISKMKWGYYFYLGGGLSTMDNQPNYKARNRASSIYRMKAINGIIDKLVGNDKPYCSVLDFACNWGGMAIDMASRGFKNVTAFDFKKENVDRAAKLSNYMKTEVDFDVENVYSLSPKYDKQFDIVLNLGLLYHVTNPIELAKITYRLTRHVAVFDTLAHKDPFSGYIQAYLSDTVIMRPGMGEQQIELHPTYRGLIDVLHFAGFKSLVEIMPIIGDDYPHREKDHYFQGHRRTIVALK